MHDATVIELWIILVYECIVKLLKNIINDGSYSPAATTSFLGSSLANVVAAVRARRMIAVKCIMRA